MTTPPNSRQNGTGVSANGGPPPREDIVRAITPGYEIRSSDPGGDIGPTLFGHFAVFNEWTLIESSWEGTFLERVAPGSFTKTFAEGGAAIKCLFQHGADPHIGMKVLGRPSVLIEDSTGAYYEVPLLHEAQYVQELLPGLREGLYGVSFRFSVLQDEYVQHPRRSAHNPTGLPERTLTEVRCREFGPCTFGAYASADAAVRSATDEFMLQRLTDNREESVFSTGLIVPTDVVPSLGVPGEVILNREQQQRLAELGDDTSDETREGARERTYERAITAATDTVWLIRPDKLDMIVQILDERARGVRLTPEEIADRIGPTPVRAGHRPGQVEVLPLYGAIVPRGGMFTDVSDGGGTSVQAFSGAFKAAMASPDVQGILIDIDSPGGSSDLVQELASQIREAVAEDTKPIWAVANTDANSAAYWIGSQAAHLATTPSGTVGSIGAYIAHRDISGQQAKEGVKVSIVKAGEFKAETSPFSPLTDSARENLQERVDTVYEKFVADVAAGRGVDVKTVLDDFGGGRVVLAEKALAAGMVDSIETYDEILARLEETVGSSSTGEGSTIPVTVDITEPEPPEATTPEDAEPEPLEAATPPQPVAIDDAASDYTQSEGANMNINTDELRARQAEIQTRLTNIHVEFGNDMLPDEIRSEWEALVAERTNNTERISEIEQRQTMLDAFVDDTARHEQGSTPNFGNKLGGSMRPPRRGPANIFAVEEYRMHFGRSADELALGFRDGALRAIEDAYFPQETISKEDAQAQAARLLDRDSPDSEIARRILQTGSQEYMRAFGKAISGKPLTSEEMRALSTAASDGGYGVPYTLDPTVINTSNGVVNPLRRIARNITIAGSNEWRGVSSSGVTAGYGSEASQVDDDSPTFDQPVINVERADAFVPFSFEIGGDFGGLQAEVAQMFAYAKDELEADKFTTGLGHGAKEPEGIITALQLLPAATVTSLDINLFQADDIYLVEEDLGPRYRPLAQWVANRSIYNKARRFANNNNEADLWIRDLSLGLDNSATGNTGATLLGYPANELSAMDSVVHGGNEILLLGDWRHFAIVDRVGTTVEYIPNLMGPNGRPTGQRGLLAWWRNSSGCLATEAFRLLVVASS